MNLTALLVNLWLSSLVANNPTLVLSPGHTHFHLPLYFRLVWTLFSVFTFLHLLANYRAVSVVCMETFNKNRSLLIILMWNNISLYMYYCRLHITIVHYLRHGVVLDPTTVNSIEPVIRCNNNNTSFSSLHSFLFRVFKKTVILSGDLHNFCSQQVSP